VSSSCGQLHVCCANTILLSLPTPVPPASDCLHPTSHPPLVCDHQQVLTLDWRQFYATLQKHHLGPVKPSSRQHDGASMSHLDQLLQLTVHANRHFPRSAAAEVVAEFNDILVNTSARQTFDALFLLHVFLPR
jgi:hypothetical protein